MYTQEPKVLPVAISNHASGAVKLEGVPRTLGGLSVKKDMPKFMMRILSRNHCEPPLVKDAD